VNLTGYYRHKVVKRQQTHRFIMGIMAPPGTMAGNRFIENVDKIAKAVYVIGDAVRIERTPDAAGTADEAP